MKDLLQISGMARSTFYYYLSHPIKDKYECEKQEITAIFNANKGRYGYRRVLMIMRKKGVCDQPQNRFEADEVARSER